MRWTAVFVILLASLAQTAAPAHAQQQPLADSPSCSTLEAALGDRWEAWKNPTPMTAASSLAGIETSTFAVGQAIALALLPDPEVAYATLPQGEGEAASFGGMARFTVTNPGLYGVGTSASVWIDVSRAGVPAEAVAFGRGVRCTPIRKVVSFDLQPGDYVLEISGSETAELDVMVAPGGLPQAD